LSRRRVVTILVALALVTVPLAGSVVADGTDDDGDQSFVAVQNGQCTPITSFSDNESVRTFYDYRIPNADNPYSNTTGNSYSSEGTRDLQRANTSIVFLYRDTANDTTSLVFVHGNEGNETSTGGSATFNITGLPEDRRWAVKDDEYNGSTNYDEWSADSGDTVVDWTWGSAATDGGAYAGLDEETAIAVQPSFNEEATLSGEYYDGTVDRWEVLSNDTNVTRMELDRRETLFIVAGTCDQFEDDETDDDIDSRTDDNDQRTETTTDTSETETPTTDTPTTDTPATETPQTETPQTETPQTETPTTEDETEEEERDDDTEEEETDDTDEEETSDERPEDDGETPPSDEDDTDNGPGASEGAPFGDDNETNDGPGASEGAPHGNGNDDSAGSSNGNSNNNGNGNGGGNNGNGNGNGGPPGLGN
jgi:cell division septation protein DedD